MWLKMDICGIIFQLCVRDYRDNPKEDYEWCSIGISYASGQWLNYTRESDETLTSYEVKDILGNIKKLLNNEMTEPYELEFIEPDFHLIFNPQKDLREDPKYTYIKEGYEIEDIDMDWRIFFWDGGLTDNFLSLKFYRSDVEILCDYLKYVVGELSEESPQIQKLIQRGILY